MKDVVSKLLDVVEELSAGLEDKDRMAATLAAKFCALSDDGQAQFFVHVARIMKEWGTFRADWQLAYIAQHLKECECSTEEAREWVRTLAEGLR